MCRVEELVKEAVREGPMAGGRERTPEATAGGVSHRRKGKVPGGELPPQAPRPVGPEAAAFCHHQVA